MATDWKDALASLKGLPEEDANEHITTKPEETSEEASTAKRQTSPLHVVMEKKGRGGKTATIIEGFTINDNEIDAIGKILRQRLGTGGSARGGEILIQGDRREDVKRILKELGFKNIKG